MKEHFGKEARFFDLLFQMRTIFAPIDQAWLQELNQEEGNEEEDFDQEGDEHRQACRIYRRQQALYPLLVELGGTDVEFEQQAPQLTGWRIHLEA